MANTATGQETKGLEVQLGQDRPWEGMDFRMEAAQGAPPDAAQPSQGDPPQPGQQPPSNDGFRAMFSDISDDQWPQVEPHLRNVQAHVTRLEQVAKPFIEAGVSPEESVALLEFAQKYSEDPVGTWLQQAQALMQNGSLDGNVLDFDELVAIATGQPSPNGGLEGQGQPPGSENPELDDLRAQLAQATQSIEYLMNERQQDQSQRQASQQKALLDKAVTTVKSELEQAGVPTPSDAMITAAIIANKGNPQAVVKDLTEYKGNVLSGISTTRQEQGQSPRMPRGAPPTPPKPTSRPGGRRDGFSDAREGATQFLRQQNEAAAQEA